jgi:hypothetical protein
MTDNIHLAVIYRLGAVNFQESAKKLSHTLELKSDGTPSNYMAIPFYFLISHSAELFLKSALLKRGFDQKDLKKHDFRHSLNSLLEELQKYGVHISPNTVTMIEGLHSQHQNHALRYDGLIRNEKMFFPPPHLMFSMLDELLLLTRISTQGV